MQIHCQITWPELGGGIGNAPQNILGREAAIHSQEEILGFGFVDNSEIEFFGCVTWSRLLIDWLAKLPSGEVMKLVVYPEDLLMASGSVSDWRRQKLVNYDAKSNASESLLLSGMKCV